MHKSIVFSFIFLLCVYCLSLFSYGLPALNLGKTNILDGGPIRPNPGFYVQQYNNFYNAHKWLDHKGDLLGCISSPKIKIWSMVTQVIYQSRKKWFLEGVPGLSVVIPYTLYSSIEKNGLDITNAGSGIGNITFGPYTQWSAVFFKERPFFIHRLSFDIGFPAITNKLPKKNVNPGVSFFYLIPSWSATLFATEKLALSWRLSYIWCDQNRKIDRKTGDALLFNYSIEYPFLRQWYLAVVGYYLQQLSLNKELGKNVPHSKERVCGLGAGSAYFFSQDLIFFTYLYGEFGVQNRTQGTSFVLRLVKHF